MKKTALTMSINSFSDFEFASSTFDEANMQHPLPLIEILWDNYCCADPMQLAAELEKFSPNIALHTMWSRFIERDLDELDGVLARLRLFVDVLNPVSISDHLCNFNIKGVRVPFALEYDYRALSSVCDRVNRYQEAIGRSILLENAASTHWPAEQQIEFIDQVIKRTECNLLFDVSNAVIGELNGLGELSLWLKHFEGKSLRCHVGGYDTHMASGIVLDTHSHDISQETIAALRRSSQSIDIISMTYERDYRTSITTCANDLRIIEKCLNE